jgi:2-iminobutanoate/2-iminopropanoate deaminase
MKAISTPKAPSAVGPYSQAIEANGFVFLSGQIPLTPEGQLVTGSISEQVTQIMQNLKAVLNEAELEFSNVVRTEIFVVDINDFAEVNQVYESFMTQPYPARFTVGIKELPKGAKVEIAMIAAK